MRSRDAIVHTLTQVASQVSSPWFSISAAQMVSPPGRICSLAHCSMVAGRVARTSFGVAVKRSVRQDTILSMSVLSGVREDWCIYRSQRT